ncbi:hypothetical protein [Geminicoccus roseus]|uniref:hypothetical protein n=1 Tax=Geminicoccus roseus TaxID=404900 RepID=UPI000429FBA8|nr:hypothetical protein [Geminicoccus roseus]
MSTLLPLDDNGHPIAILGFVHHGTQKLEVASSASARSAALPEGVRVVSLIATGPVRFELGGASVTADPASSPYLHPGVYLDLPVGGAERHVALIAESGSCQAYVIGRT